jgi:hypothetical protein
VARHNRTENLRHRLFIEKDTFVKVTTILGNNEELARTLQGRKQPIRQPLARFPQTVLTHRAALFRYTHYRLPNILLLISTWYLFRR